MPYADPEKRMAYIRRWHKANLDKMREYQRRWAAANPERAREDDRRRISFKGKSVRLGFNPRTGVCSECGKRASRTDMHHEKYDERNPLAHTVELCLSCHNKRKKK